MTTTYTVSYNHFETAQGVRFPMNIKTGFKTRSEAEDWKQANTTDGEVEEWKLL